jgi:tetratricopeptide (TPR) repeat protein
MAGQAYQMKAAVCLIIGFFVIFLPQISFSISAEEVDIIKQGQAAMLNGDFEAAYEIVSRLGADDRSDPIGYIFRAAVLQAEMIESEDDSLGDRFKALCDSTVLLSEEKLEYCTKSDSALYYLFIGHQDAYRALWEARFGSKLSALKYGFKARNQYQKGLEVDSTLYDLYLGIGSFHYWKSVKSGFLRSIGIFKDERELGIHEILLAADSSLFSREAAHSAMIWIMLNEKSYDEAIALAEAMFSKYPNGNSLLWPIAEAYYNEEKYDDAAKMYEYILNRLLDSPGNYYNIIEASYLLCQSLEKTGQSERIKEIADYIKSIEDKIPERTKERQRGHLDYLLNQR